MGKRISKLINKVLVGSEKSEDFARNSLPSNRWELFWDVFKGSFWKLVVVNLLIVLFFIPLFAVLLFRTGIVSSYGSVYPFAQGFGVGYQAPISMKGFTESIELSANMLGFLPLPLAVIIIAVGLSGGAYVIRNMVWTEGVFVANDFWRGIKDNYKQIVVISLIYSLVFYITVFSSSLARLQIVAGSSMVWIYYILEILSYVILAYFSLMFMHMITMSVTYRCTIKQLFKNSFYMTLVFLPFSIFFLFLALTPFLLFAISSDIQLLLIISLVILIGFGFSFALLVWTNYSQWAFDSFINDKVGAKKNRGIYEKYKPTTDDKTRLEHRAMVRIGLNSRPIKPITDEEISLVELPESFSREDLERLKQSKKAMYDDHDRYVQEHKDDEQFKPTEEELKKSKEEEARAKRIEKAKKALKQHEKYRK